MKDTQTFHLNSQLTTGLVLNGDYKSLMQFDLRSYINLDDDDVEYATVRMPNCVLTNSNYIVNEHNNKLIVFYGGLPFTVYIVPLGNYNKTQWIAFINGTPSSPFPNNLFTMTADPLTNKFTITTTALYNSVFPGQIYGISAGTTCDYIFGLRTLFLTNDPSFTFERAFNFLPVARFVFHCNILNSGLMMGANSNPSSCDILAVIPNSSKLNSQIIYENTGEGFLIKSNSQLNQIIISITDDDNRLINFNGISMYFSLEFNLFRKNIQRPMKFYKLVKEANKTKGQLPDGVEVIE